MLYQNNLPVERRRKGTTMEQQKDFAALGFGEVMMRLSPSGEERIAMSPQFQKHAGGSELNVMSGISRLGLRTGLISSLPDSLVGKFIRNQIRAYGVSDDYIVFDKEKDARLGIYYYEYGRHPRKPRVIYDRAHSSFTKLTAEALDASVFGKTRLFHTSGVSLAICPTSQKTAVDLLRSFKAAGATVSFDVNYRAKLWSEEEAKAAIVALLPYIDILFVSEETSRRMMGRAGSLREIQKQYCDEYDIKIVASTQRIINSPRSHDFSSLVYDAQHDTYYEEAPYCNIEVVDRLGSGDAYVAGVLGALLKGEPMERVMQFGNALSAVKNTVIGDLFSTDLDEIKSIIKDHETGSKDEMNR